MWIRIALEVSSNKEKLTSIEWIYLTFTWIWIPQLIRRRCSSHSLIILIALAWVLLSLISLHPFASLFHHAFKSRKPSTTWWGDVYRVIMRFDEWILLPLAICRLWRNYNCHQQIMMILSIAGSSPLLCSIGPLCYSLLSSCPFQQQVSRRWVEQIHSSLTCLYTHLSVKKISVCLKFDSLWQMR